MKKEMFSTRDNRKVALFVWDEVEQPKAVVKIAHGMAEYSMRYDGFCKFLNKNGFIAVMNDERGHGESAEKSSFGYEQGDMFENNVCDQLDIIEECKKRLSLPVVMMGHSYGSFLTQAVCERNPDVVGYVLSGSDYIKGISYSFCGLIANSLVKKHGESFPAQQLADLSFGMYEKRIPGKNSWLNRDANEVNKYNADEGCGFTCSAGFYSSFMKGIKPLYKKEAFSKIDVEKPILIISGSDDPVGEYSKGVEKLIAFYKNKVGVKSVESHIYQGARHEVLNETNKDEVYGDVLVWLNKVVA